MPAAAIGAGTHELNHAAHMPPCLSSVGLWLWLALFPSRNGNSCLKTCDAVRCMYAEEHGEGGVGDPFPDVHPVVFQGCKLGCHKCWLQQANSEV
jgi:hypothetical protein